MSNMHHHNTVQLSVYTEIINILREWEDNSIPKDTHDGGEGSSYNPQTST